MKSKLLILVCVMFFGLTYTQASFPVNKEKAVEVVNALNNDEVSSDVVMVDVQADSVESEEAITPAVASGYDKWVAAALWFVLGMFAAHRWYAKKPTGWNILFILTLGGLGIWAIVDIVNILTDNF